MQLSKVFGSVELFLMAPWVISLLAVPISEVADVFEEIRYNKNNKNKNKLPTYQSRTYAVKW